jgi:hypothetical protein
VGPRNCIGEGLARLEMQIHLATIGSKLRLHYLGDEPVLDLGVNLRSKHDFTMLPTMIDTCLPPPYVTVSANPCPLVRRPADVSLSCARRLHT